MDAVVSQQVMPNRFGLFQPVEVVRGNILPDLSEQLQVVSLSLGGPRGRQRGRDGDHLVVLKVRPRFGLSLDLLKMGNENLAQARKHVALIIRLLPPLPFLAVHLPEQVADRREELPKLSDFAMVFSAL